MNTSINSMTFKTCDCQAHMSLQVSQDSQVDLMAAFDQLITGCLVKNTSQKSYSLASPASSNFTNTILQPSSEVFGRCYQEKTMSVSERDSQENMNTQDSLSQFTQNNAFTLRNPFSPETHSMDTDSHINCSTISLESSECSGKAIRTNSFVNFETRSIGDTMKASAFTKYPNTTRNISEKSLVSSCFELTEDSSKILTQKDSKSPRCVDSTLNSANICRSNKFKTRMDVVGKTIMRTIKAHYVTEFKKAFDFTKRSKKANPDHSSEVYKHASQFLKKQFGIISGDMVAVFVSLIDSKQKFTKRDSKYPNLKSDFNSLLRGFNMTKVTTLMKLPEFSILCLKYFEKTTSFSEITKCSSNKEVTAAYHKKMEELSELCRSQLNF